MLDSTRRFSNRVENYLKYRPGYPTAVLDWLATECQLTPDSVLADIGSGTGILSELFLRNGNPVFGLEPNEEMRQAAERLLQNYPNFTSIAARAAATTLAENSVDFVVAGQAFHWFDPGQTRQEFARILKPDGWVALIWNERQGDATPFMQAYEQLLLAYGLGYKPVYHKRFGEYQLKAIFGQTLKKKDFENSQIFDFAGLKGRLLSSSYAPLAPHPNYEPMLAELEAIFEKHQKDGKVIFLYTTQLYYYQVQAG